MSRIAKGIAIFTSVAFVGLVIAGTAAAGTVMFPKEMERVSQIISEEAEAVQRKAVQLYDHVGHLGDLFNGVNAQGGGPTNAGGQNPPAMGNGVTRPNPVHVSGPRAAAPHLEDPLAGRPHPTNGGGQGAGSYGSGALGGTGLSAGALITAEKSGATVLNPAKPTDTTTPPATPIPGAIWLMGTGLAGVMAAKRHRNRDCRKSR